MKKSVSLFIFTLAFVVSGLFVATTKVTDAAGLGQSCRVNTAGSMLSSYSGTCRVVGGCTQANESNANAQVGNCVSTATSGTLVCCLQQPVPTDCMRNGNVCLRRPQDCGTSVPGATGCPTNELCCIPGSVRTNPTDPAIGSLSGMAVTSDPQINYQLLEQIPGSSETVGRLDTYLRDIYIFAFWAVGIAVVFMLTIGGFMYLTSAGNTSRMESAKTVIFDAILGLILALVAWLFLYVINPDLVNLNLRAISISPISSTAAPAPTAPPTGTTLPPAGGLGGTNQALAQQIRAGGNGITISGAGSCSSAAGTVSPSLSLQQAANGAPVTRCQNGCPGSGLCTQATTLNSVMLTAMLVVAQQYPYTVSSFTGGSHGANSIHYQGRAVDVVPSAPKAQWPQVAAAFRSQGANPVICDIEQNGRTVIIPCDDARADHIHAQW